MLIVLFVLSVVISIPFVKSELLKESETMIPIYEYYSESFNDHYYTPAQSQLNTDVYQHERIAFYLRQHQDKEHDLVPLYMFYRGYPVFDHYYVTNPSDINARPLIIGYCYPV